MFKIQTIITFAILSIFLTVHYTKAECCGKFGDVCCKNISEPGCKNHLSAGDNESPYKKYCCGVGDCNIMCCNCDGGCIQNQNHFIGFP